MFKKILHILVILIFFIIFGYFFGNEYWDFHTEQSSQEKFEQEMKYLGENFSLDQIHNTESEIIYTPYTGLLDILVGEIDSAREKIYVEVYIFTEKRMRDALIRAHKRGVDVKILLENNPYKAPYLNDAHYNAFQNAGLSVRWSDPLSYSLNHAKLLIIDNTSYISTGNFSYSLFSKNRDFLVKISDNVLIEKLENLFLLDFEHKMGGVVHPNLVISPYLSRDKMQKMLIEANESIDMYFPYFTDNEFEQHIFDAAGRGVKIRMIVEKSFYEEESEIINKYKQQNIQIYPIVKYKLHAKAILVDSTYLYIGSINFSRYSFDENREIGVLLRDKNSIKKFNEVFESDL